MNKIKYIFLLLFIFSYSFASSLFNKLEKKLQEYGTFKANIKEEMFMNDFDGKDVYLGKIFITKKGEVLLNFSSPEKMFIYIDKNGYVYGYSYEDEEGYMKKLSNSEFYLELFKRFLSKESLENLFKEIKEEKSSQGYIFYLVPKNKEIKKVILETDKDFNMKKVEIYTEDGKVIYYFSNIEYSKDIKPIPEEIKKLIDKIKKEN